MKLKQKVKALAAVLVGSGLLAFAAAPALCADEFCAMGGVLIKADVVKDKALEWGKDRKKVLVAGEDTDGWSVLTLSRTDDDIAILVTANGAFFGVAGKGGNEVDARDAEKAFGRDFRKLEDAVKKELTDLWKAGALKLQGADIQLVANALGLGTLEKGRAWELTTQSCKGTDLNTSDLK
jgi:hypothetical protein